MWLKKTRSDRAQKNLSFELEPSLGHFSLCACQAQLLAQTSFDPFNKQTWLSQEFDFFMARACARPSLIYYKLNFYTELSGSGLDPIQLHQKPVLTPKQ